MVANANAKSRAPSGVFESPVLDHCNKFEKVNTFDSPSSFKFPPNEPSVARASPYQDFGSSLLMFMEDPLIYFWAVNV